MALFGTEDFLPQYVFEHGGEPGLVPIMLVGRLYMTEECYVEEFFACLYQEL